LANGLNRNPLLKSNKRVPPNSNKKDKGAAGASGTGASGAGQELQGQGLEGDGRREKEGEREIYESQIKSLISSSTGAIIPFPMNSKR